MKNQLEQRIKEDEPIQNFNKNSRDKFTLNVSIPESPLTDKDNSEIYD